MKDLFSASLFVLAPLSAAALPYLYVRFQLGEKLRLERFPLPRFRGGAALPASVHPEIPSGFPFRHAFRGVLMSATVFATTATLAGSSPNGSLGVLLFGVIVGLILGTLALVTCQVVEDAARSWLPARNLERLGMSAVWSAEHAIPFRRELLATIKRHGTLDVLAADGLDVLTAISHNAHPPLTAPHPSLRGAHVTLLILPPQSKRVDPETRGRTTAAVAVSRLGTSPEEHWRQLTTTLEVQQLWAEQYGLELKILFLENIPAFHLVKVGERVWFRPWEETQRWMESRGRQLSSALHHLYVDARSLASPDLEVRMGAGPTKTTFIRKGIDVPTPRPASRLLVVDEQCVEA